MLDALGVAYGPVGADVHGLAYKRHVAAGREEELGGVVAELEARVALEHVPLRPLDNQTVYVAPHTPVVPARGAVRRDPASVVVLAVAQPLCLGQR